LVAQQSQFLKESKILSKLNHPCIISVNTIFISDNYVYIETPFYAKGNLKEWVTTSKPSNIQLQAIFHQVLLGIEYLHHSNIIHCDIRPENIFIDAENHAKIGHFDVSKDTATRLRATISTATSISGALQYVAPGTNYICKPSNLCLTEIHNNIFTSKCDIFSLGVSMFECYFPKRKILSHAEIVNRTEFSFPNDESLKSLIYLLKSMLKYEHQQRFSATEALTHSYFMEGFSSLKQELQKEMFNVEQNEASFTQQRSTIQQEIKDIQKTEEKLQEEEQKMLLEGNNISAKLQQRFTTLDNKKKQLQDETQKIKKEIEQVNQLKEKLKNQVNIPLPTYWTNSRIDKYRVDVTNEMKAAIQTTFNNTCISKYIGIGRDSHRLKFKGFQVVKVERIQNEILWTNFFQKRHRILADKV
jgi:NIMA (never in mitosis gene a)-related kinase